MNLSLNRRNFLALIGIFIGAKILAKTNTIYTAEEQNMRKINLIRLRPYHPTYVITFFWEGGSKKGSNRAGFNHVIQAIQKNPDIEVEFVECFDDVCQYCELLRPSPKGSVWGRSQTCRSAENPVVVKEVTEANRQVLNLLGLQFGAIISLKELLPLMRDRLPDISKSGIKMIGGPELQEKYEKGLKTLSAHLNI